MFLANWLHHGGFHSAQDLTWILNHVLSGVTGPTLRFHTDLIVAVTGAAFKATLDGKPLPLWQSFKAPKGSLLAIGKVEGQASKGSRPADGKAEGQSANGKSEGQPAGCRGYIAVGGGLDVPLYLGSRSTFPGGKLGGLQVHQVLSASRYIQKKSIAFINTSQTLLFCVILARSSHKLYIAHCPEVWPKVEWLYFTPMGD